MKGLLFFFTSLLLNNFPALSCLIIHLVAPSYLARLALAGGDGRDAVRPPVPVRAVCHLPGEEAHGGQGQPTQGDVVERQDGQVNGSSATDVVFSVGARPKVLL